MRKNKGLKLTDATKSELLEYFFAPICEGREHLQYNEDRFLIWLNYKRNKEIIDEKSNLAEKSHDLLEEFIELSKQITLEDDSDVKMKLIKRSNKLWDEVQKLESKQKKLDKKDETDDKKGGETND